MSRHLSRTVLHDTSWRLSSQSPRQTADLGRLLGQALEPGDCVALCGDLGAGKSHLARALIRRWLGDPRAHIPSPSYTLVNVYHHASGEIWHADLYRLGTVEELDELGLHDALSRAVVVVEWANRWDPPPDRRLEIGLTATGPEVREIMIKAHGTDWDRVATALETLA